MKTIWRYDLEFDFDEKQTLVATLKVPYCYSAPEDSLFILSAKQQVVKVDTIRNIPSIWFMVDTEKEAREVKIYAYGTGHEIAEDIERKDYIGSFIIGPEIYHCFIR